MMGPHDAHVLAWLAWLEEIRDWHDALLAADHWFSLSEVEPNQAAMLMCRFNPDEGLEKDWLKLSTDETKPKNHTEMLRQLNAANKAESRTLRQWWELARGWKHHSWIDRYVQFLDWQVSRSEVQKETAAERNKRRYQMCLDADLEMPRDTYSRLPVGIGDLAKSEGISTAAFSKSLKAHIGAGGVN